MKRIIPLVSVFCIISCTSYHEMKKNGSGGYGEYKTENSTLIVYFGGNGLTPEYRIKRFAMIRCAEVTLESYCKYFVILTDYSYRTEHSSANFYPKGNMSTLYFPTSSSMQDVAFEIDLYQNTPDSSVKNYYDAQDVIDAKGRVEIKIERNYTRQ